MKNKFLGLLGLARRAGSVTYGMTAVLDEIYKRKSKLVILTEDFADNSAKQLDKALETDRKNPKVITVPYSKEEIGFSIGSKPTGIVSVSDVNFKKGLLDSIAAQVGEDT